MIFKRREDYRVCNQCGVILTEREVEKHYAQTGHVGYTIIRITLPEVFRRCLALEVRIKKLEEDVKKLMEMQTELDKKISKEKRLKKSEEEMRKSNKIEENNLNFSVERRIRGI